MEGSRVSWKRILADKDDKGAFTIIKGRHGVVAPVPSSKEIVEWELKSKLFQQQRSGFS